jgi:hypothetical protein
VPGRFFRQGRKLMHCRSLVFYMIQSWNRERHKHFLGVVFEENARDEAMIGVQGFIGKKDVGM